jgi:hypothetical protein
MTPPGPVSKATVENLKGEARLTYTMPGNNDLLYVKAVYTIRPGVTRETRASFYTNTMLVDGFRDTSATEVKLYAVNRSEVASVPTSVIVRPGKPAYLNVFDSLKVEAAFGGINVRSVNPEKKPMAFIILLKDQYGIWKQYDAIYTSVADINQYLRGMDTTLKHFAIYVRDQFQNQSDTLFADLKPLFEEKIPKSKFKAYVLPGDVPVTAYTRQMSFLWDEIYSGWGTAIATYETVTDTITGAWFSFDMGQVAQLSRFSWWHYADPGYFMNASMRSYELWGSTNPNPNGSWDGWVKLTDCMSVKPSGLPYATENTDDKTAGAAGEGFNIPITAPPVRYIRVKCRYNWSSMTRQTITGCEISLWGKVQ